MDNTIIHRSPPKLLKRDVLSVHYSKKPNKSCLKGKKKVHLGGRLYKLVTFAPISKPPRKRFEYNDVVLFDENKSLHKKEFVPDEEEEFIPDEEDFVPDEEEFIPDEEEELNIEQEMSNIWEEDGEIVKDGEFADFIVDDGYEEESLESEDSTNLMFYMFHIMIRERKRGGWKSMERTYYWKYLFKQLGKRIDILMD